MAELTRKEFASMCQTTESIVRSNISRGKITEYIDESDGKTKLIDTRNAKNKAFFDKYIKLSETRKPKKKKPKVDNTKIYDEVVEKVDVKKSNKRSNDQKQQKQNDEDAIAMDWDRRKKKADAILQERKAEKEELQLQKLAGKLIPVDLVFSVLRIHNNDIFATFQNDVENLASVYCDILAGGDRKKLAKLTSALSERLNDAVKRAREVSESSIRAAVDDYSETRNKGERK